MEYCPFCYGTPDSSWQSYITAIKKVKREDHVLKNHSTMLKVLLKNGGNLQFGCCPTACLRKGRVSN